MKLSIVSLLMATTLISCSKENKSSSVVTNFALTGSGQNAVAQTNFLNPFSWLIPTAVALSPAPLEDLNGAVINLNEAWIVLKKIQFSSQESETSGEGNNYSAHYQGPFFIDLLSDAPVSFGEVSLPESGLRRVKMLLHKENNVPSYAPAALSGKSIYFNGIVNAYNFIYAADDTTDFQISGPNAVVPEESNDLLAVIRIADVFKKIDLSGINADTIITSASRFPAVNPCPAIHPTAPDLYTCFKMGIALEAKFGKDNGDKDLDGSDDIVN
ncbi:MAG TPA: hypothetical protein VNJ08_10275 [Bacteriovoracaceae bacterium]|nr:hypothetical protein [Bacteriovoracaceae bacterium]